MKLVECGGRRVVVLTNRPGRDRSDAVDRHRRCGESTGQNVRDAIEATRRHPARLVV
jgi:hypothetical protein